MPDPTPKRLVLIDGNSLLYRGFFAMRALTTSAGQPTNAVFSFTMMLLTLLNEQKPDVIISAWDTSSTPTFRHTEYKEYKGTRSATPTELVQQGPLARELVQTFNIPMIEAPGFEADDIIGTLAKRGRELGYDVLIVTGDLDALQLVEPGVQVMTNVKGVTDTTLYDEAAVKNRYGLRPDQLADYRALKGDTSDNIPGVPGVGEKTASQLLQQYETVENLVQHIEEIKQAKLKASLEAGKDQMDLSKRLATIIRDVPLEGVNLPAPKDAPPYAPDYAKVRELFERLEFRTLLRRLPDGETKSPVSTKSSGGSTADPLASEDYDPFADTGEETPAPVREPEPPADYRVVETDEETAAMVAAVKAAHRVGVCLHAADATGLLDAQLCGVALAVGDGTVFYVSLEDVPAEPAAETAREAGSADDLGGLFAEESPKPTAASAKVMPFPSELAALLADPKVPKVTHDTKTVTGILRRYEVALRNVVFDTELAAYLLNAGRRANFPLHEIVSDYAGRELHPLDKKERKGMEASDIRGHERSETLAGADAILATMRVQEPRIAAEGLTKVLETLDLPVAPILADMELAGVAVDTSVFHRLSQEMGTKIADLERQIHELAGETFQINSTKQLQTILFEKLNLPAGKKTKTGYSTDAEVLEELAPEYPIVSLILQYRELAKLKSTYSDAMPALVRPDTGRLHTSLNQTVAATGRLSSTNPNLQNIPIRTEIGREIRKAFIAPPGCILVSADYSQIELRLFANVSKDPELVAAFSSGEDIHKYTASRIFSVPVDEVTTDMRRAAKTVNYAVIYGISDFALGRQLKIPQSQAKELKTSYFARFPGVKAYIEETLKFAREKGYVQTMFGRKRWIPDINSRVFQFRQAAERAAANMPIQGTSADIMKLAMIGVHQMLKESKFEARLLLQVHDELLFEAPPDEVPELAAKVRDRMRNAYPLDVPLDVDVKTGATWADVTPLT
jgi:DNA polymerase-1